MLAKEAQDPAKPNIFSSSGILVTNFQSPFLSFYFNDFEFISGFLRSRTRTGKFPMIFLRIFFLHCKEDGSFGGEKTERNERDIERALGSRGTFLSRAGVGPHTSQLKSIF